MWESGGKMWTPALSAGCLPGIVREILIEKFDLAEMEGVRATLLAADAIYLLSSTRLIQQVSKFDDKEFNFSAAGQVLLGEFQAAIAENSDL
jgi:branched-subunit amino acid aminotransferase/4-amino-4-deoxychorismate lyase